MKKLFASAIVVLSLGAVAVTPTVTDMTAKQRYPWNGKVDITYTLTGDVTAGLPAWNVPFLSVTASNRVDGTTYAAAASALSGDTGTAEGAHHVVWDLDAQGLEINSDEVTFTVGYVPISIMRYCVVDLSGGARASSYPVSYLADVPSGGWTDEYKTTKLVLRLIEPGTFMMGGSYQVTLTKPFYCGVFEVTHAQYVRVTADSNPSSYLMWPAWDVSWTMIRGDSSTYNWPSSANVDSNSFVGRLQARTGLNFDLPTEAQWEYACRAGTTSKFNNGGDTEDDLKQLGRYGGNQSDGKGWYEDGRYGRFTRVGSYQPNAWGLYDMHGNVSEWCLDWFGDLANGVTDPQGPSFGTDRVRRGGSWYVEADGCTSSTRWDWYPWYEDGDYNVYGFRLVRTPSNTEGERSPEAVAGAERADALCIGDSAPVAIDSRTETRESAGDEVISYSSLWDGDVTATVMLAQGGIALAEGLTGEGDLAWSVERNGTYTLTHTTFTNGVAGAVETAVFRVTGKTMPFAAGDVTTTGYSGTYDGVAHGIGVTVASGIEGVTVTYAHGAAGTTQPDGEWSATPPTFADAGEYMVWCEVDAPGYIPLTNTVAVTISPYPLGDAEVALGGSLTYNGAEQVQPVAGVTSGGFDVTYTVSGNRATHAGTYTLTVSGTGNFTGTATQTFTIAKAKNEWVAEPAVSDWTYDGAAHAASFGAAKFGTAEVSYGSTGAGCPTDAGDYTATFTVQGTSDYEGLEISKPFTVFRKGIAGAVVALGAALTYNGAEQAQAVTGATIDGLSATYEVSGNTATEAGTHTLTVTGTGNFTGAATKAFTIARKDIARAEVTLGAALTYTGLAQAQAVADVFVDGLSATYAVSGNTATEAGTYTLTVTGKGNFAGTATKTYTIARKDIAGAVVTLGTGLVYSGEAQAQAVASVMIGGLSATYDVSGNTATEAGTHTLTVTGTGNFTGTVTKQYAVAPKDIASAEITLGASPVYTGAEQTQTVTGVVVDGLVVTCDVSGNTATDAGTYALTVTGTGNFAGTATAQWWILPADISVSAVSYDGVYDGEGHGIEVTVSRPENGWTVTYALSAEGPYCVESPLFTNKTESAVTVWYAVEAANFKSVTNVATVSIAPKALEDGMVTLAVASLTYDGTAKEPSVTVKDGAPSILSEADYSVSYSDNVELGTAAVTVTGRGNYTGVVVKTFEIMPESVELGGTTWRYVVRDGEVEIVGADVTSEVVVIPDEINGMPVASVMSGSLADNAQLVAVIVGRNVERLGARAFGGCPALELVVFRGTGLDDLEDALDGVSEEAAVYFEEGEPACPEIVISPATGVKSGRTAVTVTKGGWGDIVTVRYTTDGTEPTAASAAYVSRFSLVVDSLVVVRAAAFVGGVRVGAMAETRYSPNIEDVLDVAGQMLEDGSAPVSFAMDVAHPWTVDAEVDSPDGTPSMRSGEIGDDSSTWMSASFEGAGMFLFSWKTSSEYDDLGEYWYDHAVCELDGEPVAWLDGVTDWTRVQLEVRGGGAHTVVWRYVKDDADDSDYPGEDCAWVDMVKFAPSVTISYVAGGASGEVPAAVSGTYGSSVDLPGQGLLSYAKHQFVGWTDGEDVYYEGHMYAMPTTNAVLTAVWNEKRLVDPVVDVEAMYDGVTTAVTIWAEDGAEVWYTLDGSEPSVTNGTLYAGAFAIDGTTTIKAIAVRNDYFDSSVVVAESVRSWGTLNECLDNTTLVFTTGGDAPWFGTTAVSHVGGTSARSGAIGDLQSSWIETTVTNEGNVSFWWKTSSEAYKKMPIDILSFSVDGVEMSAIGGVTEWEELTVDVTGPGAHTLRWEYVKDEADSVGEDCGWLDRVSWTPAVAPYIIVDAGDDKTVSVPRTWIEGRTALVEAVNGDAEAALYGTAANGRKVWECYVVGLDPEIATNDFKISSFPMKADGTPDLANIAVDPPKSQWNVPGARAVVKGAATLDGEWKAVEGATAAKKAAMRFFKVVVEVK